MNVTYPNQSQSSKLFVYFGVSATSSSAERYFFPGFNSGSSSAVPQGIVIPFGCRATVINKTDATRGVGSGTMEYVLVTIDASDVASETSLTTGAQPCTSNIISATGSVTIASGTKIGVKAKPGGTISSTGANLYVTIQLETT